MRLELVFIHGWGFDGNFWRPLRQRLPQFQHHVIERGYFSTAAESDLAALPPTSSPRILIGHSLGFMYGLQQHYPWAAHIAINSFPAFVARPGQPGCVPATVLHAMRLRLHQDCRQTLQDFHAMIDSIVPDGIPDQQRLCDGLDELKSGSLSPVSIPGLMMASQNDPLVPPAASEALGRLYAQGQCLLHPAGGHILPLQEPDWCATSIMDFLAHYFPG